MERYKITKTLGDGSFGTVFKAIDLHDNSTVAIKKMKQKYPNWDECVQLRQVKSLRKLDHPNLIKLKEVIKIHDELYLVFDFLELNLYQVYNNSKEKGRQLTENEIRGIVYQIAQGLTHLHKSGFFHRDMKPENILFGNNVVKLCDFGLAREIRSRPPFTEYVSTRWYRAPELLLRSTNYNSPVDVFALGCIMAQLYLMNPLLPGTNQLDQLGKTIELLGTPSKADWPEGYKLALAMNFSFPEKKKQQLAEIISNASSQAIDLLQSMLQYNSRKRPSAAEILKHPFFEKLNNAQKLTMQIEQKQPQKQTLTKFQSLENNSIVFAVNLKVENPKEMEMRKSKLRFGHRQPNMSKETSKNSNNNNTNSIGVTSSNTGSNKEIDLNISRRFEQIEEILEELSKKEAKQKQQQQQFQSATEATTTISRLPQIKQKGRKEQTRENEDYIKLPFFNQTNSGLSLGKLPLPSKLPFQKSKY